MSRGRRPVRLDAELAAGPRRPRRLGSGRRQSRRLVTSTRSSKVSCSDSRRPGPDLVRRSEPERLQDRRARRRRSGPRAGRRPWKRSQSGFRDVSGWRAVISTTTSRRAWRGELGDERPEVRDVVQHVVAGHHVSRRDIARDVRPAPADLERPAVPSRSALPARTLSSSWSLSTAVIAVARGASGRQAAPAPAPTSSTEPGAGRAPPRPVRRRGPREPRSRRSALRVKSLARQHPGRLRACGEDLVRDRPGLEVGPPALQRSAALTIGPQTLKRISSTSPS